MDQRLTRAFAKLRCDGYFADARHADGAAARERPQDPDSEKIVLYHGQDADQLA